MRERMRSEIEIEIGIEIERIQRFWVVECVDCVDWDWV
jgi:hypothetical protein